MTWNIFKRVSYTAKKLFNSDSHLPRDIEKVGRDDNRADQIEQGDEKSVDFVDDIPHKVRRTVKNRRFAAGDYQVAGILKDIISKSNGEYIIEGTSPKVVKYLEDFAEKIDLNTLINEIIWKGLVEGTGYLNMRVVDNHIKPRWLFYDGEDYLIVEVYDDNGDLEVVNQKVLVNKVDNKNTRADNVTEQRVPDYFSFNPDELIICKYDERDGRSHALIDNVLDEIYYKRSILRLMPVIVSKNTTIMKTIVGTEANSNAALTMEQKKEIDDIVSDYHLKSSVFLPKGIDINMVKGNTLPLVQDYLKFYEKCIYVGMNTPEAIFSSESSNRATADIQLTSETAGRVLSYRDMRDWFSKYIKLLFKRELELNNISGEGWITFVDKISNPEEDDNQGDDLHKPINKYGEGHGKSTKIVKSSNKDVEGTINKDVPKPGEKLERLKT